MRPVLRRALRSPVFYPSQEPLVDQVILCLRWSVSFCYSSQPPSPDKSSAHSSGDHNLGEAPLAIWNLFSSCSVPKAQASELGF